MKHRLCKGHRGMLQSAQGVKEQDIMKETQEWGMTHFSITQTWEPSPGVTAERAALHWGGAARLGKAGYGASS